MTKRLRVSPQTPRRVILHDLKTEVHQKAHVHRLTPLHSTSRMPMDDDRSCHAGDLRSNIMNSRNSYDPHPSQVS